MSKNIILLISLLLSSKLIFAGVENNALEIENLKKEVRFLKGLLVPQDFSPVIRAKELTDKLRIDLEITQDFLDLPLEVQREALISTERCIERVSQSVPNVNFAIKGIHFGEAYDETNAEFQVGKVFMSTYSGRSDLSLNVLPTKKSKLDTQNCVVKLIGNGLK